jgi:uncharacterized protein YlzI (FlbEa/FlbD family)
MSYKNPKAAPINTGAAVYQGIQKLAGDVYTFAKEEQTRKGQLISESLAAQQAIDDNVNKMGLSLEEGEDNFEKQIFEQAQAAKQKIAAQYDAMSRTFSSPEQRAKAKAEINKLNKYPEELVADLSTGKYLVDQFNKGLLVEQGQTGSISKTNNLDLLEVIKDMKGGGKNTKMETNEAGARTLVTSVNGKSYRLNISNITNGLKTNPKQMIFNTVSDDSSITKNYQTAMGISGNKDLAALVSEGIVSKTSKETVAGKAYEIYTINKDALNQRASALSKSLVDDPQNYNYANSIWQDKLGNSVSLKEAIVKEGKETVLNQIRTHYVDQAIEASGLNKAISAQMPKPEKAGRYETDKLLETLAENPETEITVKGKKYKIFKKGNKEYIQRQKVVMIYPQKSVKGVIMDDTEKEGTPGYKYDTDDLIPLRNKNNKLNYKYFRSLTEDIQRK